MWGSHVLDVVAVGHVGVWRLHRAVDRLDVVHEDKDAAGEDQQHRDDAKDADGIEAKEEV